MHAPRVMAGVLATFVVVAGTGTALADPPGGPHTPVTICHKPGTPAEHTLVVDDDAVPGHLGHGDFLGPCTATPPLTAPPGATPPGAAAPAAAGASSAGAAGVPAAGAAVPVQGVPRTTG